MLARHKVKQIKKVTVRAHQKQSNEKVLKEAEGKLTLLRRRTIHIDRSTHGPCSGCLGYYMITGPWKHRKYFCIQKDNFKKSAIDRIIESGSLNSDYRWMDGAVFYVPVNTV